MANTDKGYTDNGDGTYTIYEKVGTAPNIETQATVVTEKPTNLPEVTVNEIIEVI